jgi:hypothetical protein
MLGAIAAEVSQVVADERCTLKTVCMAFRFRTCS